MGKLAFTDAFLFDERPSMRKKDDRPEFRIDGELWEREARNNPCLHVNGKENNSNENTGNVL